VWPVLFRASLKPPLPLRLGLGQLFGTEHLVGLRYLQLRIRVRPLRIRQVVHREQPVAAENLPVDMRRQLLGVLEQRSHRRVEVDMHAALVAGDAQADAQVVLARRLGVGTGGRADIQLAGLGLVARVVFIADRHRAQVQRLDHLAERLVLAAHVEHLEDRRIGTVVAVLGPTLGLGDPDRRTVVADRVVDVGRKQLVGRQLLAPAADGAVHDEALVQAHHVADERLLQQVVADGDARGRQAGVVHGVVDEGRVHDDVTVVGQEQIGGARLELLDAGVGNTVGGPFDGVIDVELDLVLQGCDALHPGELLAQAPGDQRLEQPAEAIGHPRKAEPGQDIEECRIAEQACQNGRDFSVVIGSDGIEFAHHALLL
ncbi:hypothetical protein COLO4_02140, partial [Corchorus olitorius]